MKPQPAKKPKVFDAEHSAAYIEFLKKRLDSANYKENVSAAEYEETKKKYDRERAKFKLLSKGKG